MVPVLTKEQKEAIVQEWAQEQMQDSRFMYLPADLARLLICYVHDAAIAEHKSQRIEIAKAMMWKDEKSEIHTCQCGAVVVVCDGMYYGGTICDDVGCEVYAHDSYVCFACARHCQDCGTAECPKHYGNDLDLANIHTCSVCQWKQCDECYVDDTSHYKCVKCHQKLCSRCAKPTDNFYEYVCGDGYGCQAQN